MTTKAELLKMIRRNCCACMGGSAFLVEGCTCPDCEFFEFRDGKDPWPTRKGNRKALEKARAVLSVAKEKGRESTNDIDRRAE